MSSQKTSSVPECCAGRHHLAAGVSEALHDVLLLHGNPGELAADLEWCCVAQALVAECIHPLHVGDVGTCKAIPLRL